jgi:hypothetical protein
MAEADREQDRKRGRMHVSVHGRFAERGGTLAGLQRSDLVDRASNVVALCLVANTLSDKTSGLRFAVFVRTMRDAARGPGERKSS